MLRIRTLGGLFVVADNGRLDPIALQRLQLALVALVASSRDRGMTRDLLMAYLWPERDITSARHSLKQTIFTVRRDLGAAVFRGTSCLRLDGNVIRSDCDDFEAAIVENRIDDALSLYAGPFLDGFHLERAPEFERWVDSERDRIGRAARDALESDAARAALQRNPESAQLVVRRWRQLVALDPISSRYALGLMSALAAAGDTPGAVRAGIEHEARVHDELESPADPAVSQLAERLRRVSAVPAIVSSPRRSTSTESRAPDRLTDSGVPPAAKPVRRTKRSRVGAGALAAVACAGLALISALLLRDGPRTISASVEPPAHVVAVFPFTTFGTGGDSAFFRHGVAELLSRDLDGAGDLRSADFRAIDAYDARHSSSPDRLGAPGALAARFGAGSYVLGEAIRSGPTLRLAASLYASGDSAPPSATAQVEGDSLHLLDLIDQLAAALLGRSGSVQRDGLDRLAARTTTSLTALKAYLRGEMLFRDARYTASVDALQRAVAADSTFALAYYRMAEASDWASDWRLSVRAAERAYRLRGRVTAHTELLLDGFRSWRTGDIDRAEGDYRDLLRWNPASVEARYQLGEVLFHNNPSRGRSVLEARRPFEQVLTVDPDDGYALSHLIRLYAIADDTVAVDTLGSRLIAAEPSGESRLGVETLRAVAMHDSAATSRVLRQLSSASDQVLLDSFERVAVCTGDLDDADSIAALLTVPQRARVSRADGFMYAAAAATARGRWSQAAGDFTAAEHLSSDDGLAAHALLASTPMIEVPAEELRKLRDALTMELTPVVEAPPDDVTLSIFRPLTRLYVIGLLDIRLGDTTAAIRQAMAAEHVAREATIRVRGRLRGGSPDVLDEDARSVSASLRGLAAAAAGRHTEAVDLLRESAPHVWLEFLASYAGARSIERFALAGQLEALGRYDDALRWYSSIAERYWFEVPLRAPAELREAKIDERLGRRSEAIAHYQTFLRLWNHADTTELPVIRDASQHLALLRKTRSG